jgi:hypothetical protein
LKYWRPAALSTVAAIVAGLASGLTPAQGVSDQLISYHGYQVTVPADWKVVDLAKHPTACLRFDQSAVYLGHSDAQPNCPSHLAGRTEGLVIEPLASATAGRDAAVALPGTATAPAGTRSVDGEIQVAAQDAGVLVTAYHAPDQEQVVRKILDSAQLTGGGTAARLVRPKASALATTASVVATGTLNGKAFDACTAPPQSTMDAWKSPASPYTAVGIYISGGLRACSQPNLTQSWVAANAANGWQFLLLDVGMQAPCSIKNYSSKMSSDPVAARAQGRTAAAGAAAAAASLGFGQRSAIYTDIENYTPAASCTAAVLSYISGWTLELNTRGYVGGAYVNAGSGGRDLSNAYNNTSYTRPDNLWFARWNKVPTAIDDSTYISTAYWTNHQRVHQYNNLTETHGGITLNIDANAADLTAPPPPVTGFDATGAYASASLHWTAPAGTPLGQIVVRRNTGTTPPAIPNVGTTVYAGTASSTTATGLANSTSYAFRAWVKDSSGKFGPPVDTRLIGSQSTAATSSPSIAYGGAVTLYSRVTRIDTGASLVGVPVSLYGRTKNSSTWREVARVTSSSSGSVSYLHKPTVSTVYQWGYNGSPDLLGSRSGNATVEVRPTITAYLSSAAIKLGGSTVFYGYLRPQHPGQTVYLQRSPSWASVSTGKLNTTGNYGFTIKPTARGTYSYRVVWLADGDHATTVSATKTFTVS